MTLARLCAGAHNPSVERADVPANEQVCNYWPRLLFLEGHSHRPMPPSAA